MKKVWIYLLLLAIAIPVQAEEMQNKEVSPWTVRAGLTYVPLLSLKQNLEVAYRLPGNHWDVFIYGNAPLPSLSYSSIQIGTRYYFNPEDEKLNYFAMARGGVSFFDGTGTIFNPDGTTEPFGGWQTNAELAAGVGLDWNWNEHFGLTAGIYGGLPVFVIPDVALKYRF